MQLSIEQVRKIARKPLNAAAVVNASSVLVALTRYGSRFGLDQPHRLAQFLPQIMHESGDFRYDREVWGPTPAQKRYDTRTDLGNTPERDGDGKLYAGHTAMQITGRANTKAFRDWCRKHIDADTPDFLRFPDLMNTDPWEGLGPLWYWDTRNLNKFADQGDVEMVTKRINGGLNGFEDRIELLARASLVLLDFGPDDIRGFQIIAGLQTDGIPGPKTRAALHARLLALTAKGDQPADAAAAPVVEEKQVAVTPPALDKPVEKTGGFWERIGQIALAGGSGFAALLGDWRVVVAIAGASIVLGGLGILFHARIIAAVRELKREITA